MNQTSSISSEIEARILSGNRCCYAYGEINEIKSIKQKLKVKNIQKFNPLNAELNPIRYLLALLGAHHFLHVSRIRVNKTCSDLRM
jgi:hypothetical protein